MSTPCYNFRLAHQAGLYAKLKPEVLPFSNIPAYLSPFWLSPQQAMRLV